MDGDIDDVVVVVGDLNHLLHSLALRSIARHAHQTAEASDAVIHVNHVVADVELLQFLEREGDLARAGAFAAQVELVEAVEDLVVGEQAHLQVVVGKAFVQGLGNGGEGENCVVLSIEYGLETVGLLGRVGEDVDGVALGDVVLEGGGDEVEVLVEDGLGGDGERPSGLSPRPPC